MSWVRFPSPAPIKPLRKQGFFSFWALLIESEQTENKGLEWGLDENKPHSKPHSEAQPDSAFGVSENAVPAGMTSESRQEQVEPQLNS